MATAGVSLGIETGFAAADQSREVEANTARTEQLTQLAKAQTDLSTNNELKAQQLQMLMRMPSPAPQDDGGIPTPLDLAGQVDSRAQILLNAGFAKEGADLGEKAALMRSHAAMAARETATSKKQELDGHQKSLEQMDGMLAVAKDQTSLNAVVLSWEAQHPDDPIPDQLRTYDPNIFDALRHGTKQGLALVKSQKDELTASEAEVQRKAQRDHMKALEAESDARLAAAKEKEDRIIKNGGAKAVKVGEPTKEGVALADSIIKKDFPDLAPDVITGKDTATTQAAMAVSSDAKARMAHNPGLSLMEATNAAYLAAKDRGDFKPAVKAPGWFAKDTPASYHYGGGADGGGGSAQPAAIPADAKIHPAPSSAKDVVQGQYYEKGGKFYQATPQGMKEIS